MAVELRMLPGEVLQRANDLLRAAVLVTQRVAQGLVAMSCLAGSIAVGGRDGDVQVLTRVKESRRPLRPAGNAFDVFFFDSGARAIRIAPSRSPLASQKATVIDR